MEYSHDDGKPSRNGVLTEFALETKRYTSAHELRIIVALKTTNALGGFVIVSALFKMHIWVKVYLFYALSVLDLCFSFQKRRFISKITW